MDMGFAPTWLRQVSPPPASQNHFNHWFGLIWLIDWVIGSISGGNSNSIDRHAVASDNYTKALCCGQPLASEVLVAAKPDSNRVATKCKW